ncbi:MAG TPA: tape measure protein [Nitrospira sp.]|nr:tape measure protein [Nitrospira sp.]
MAKSVDNRVVSITFDNAKFEANVKATINSLTTLDAAIRKVGNSSGLDNISKAANKIDFKNLSDAIDKINAKLALPEGAKGLSDLEKASDKTQLTGVAGALDKVKQKLGFDTKPIADIEGASNRVTLSGLGNALDKVKTKLASIGSGDEFTKIEGASNRVDMSGLSSAIDSVSVHLGALQVAAVSAFGTIVSKATSAGGSIIKSLTVDPPRTGLQEYETQLNAIQTILANTQASGATLGDVNKALNELNHYADKTIYNFSEMAKNIGTFTAAGVDLKTATSSIKGIANLAALSGSNSQQASTAMYQLSQAISSGRVSLQDWNSVVNAGMGGSVFQRALVQTAVKMGTLNANAVEFKGKMKNAVIEGKSFRESIMSKPGEQSWLSKEVLTGTLKQFTGDMTDAELAAQGFTKAQIKAIQTQAKTAVDAATKVKTLSGVIDTAKEAAGSGWAATWQIIFGDFNEARTTFTNISNALNGFITNSAKARNAILGDWKKLGGRTALFDGLKNVLEGIGSVLKPIKEAFREIFPKKTGQDLYDLTVKFRDLTEKLKLGPEKADALRRTFAGFFAVIHIGTSIVGHILGTIAKLIGIAGKGSGGFLEFTAKIGDFLVAIDQAVTKGGALNGVFDGIASVLAVPIKLITSLGDALSNLFGGDNASAGQDAADSMNKLGGAVSPLAGFIKVATAAWNGFVDALKAVGSLFAPITDIFGDFGNQIADALSQSNFDNVFTIIQTTLIGGIFLTIKKALGKGVGVEVGGGLFKSLGETFKILNTNLMAIQNNIKANTLLQIAAAIGILAVGVLILSTIDPKKLASSMTAVAVGLGQLIGAMSLLTKIGGVGAFATMPFIAGSLILLAVAVDILAVAVIALSQLSWGEIAKGLAGVGGALIAISIGTKLMGPQLLAVGPALIPIAIALNLMAVAMKIFATMSWEDMAKGLVGVAAGLAAVGLAARLVGPGLLLSGPGLILMAAGLNILAVAVLAFGKMDLKTLATGIIAATAAIALLGLAAGLLPPTLALQAAGLVILGVALTGIAAAVKLMGSMSIGELATGIIGLGAALVVLAGGLTLMSGTLLGAAGLTAAAIGLAILVPVLGTLGTMKWSTIGKGLAAIALSMGVIAAVSVVAAPALMTLGLALIVLGAGTAAIGAGVYLIAKALVLMGTQGTKGIAVMVTAITAFVALIPTIIINFIKGLVGIADGIASVAPHIAVALGKIIMLALNLVIAAAPKMAQAAIALMTAFITVVNSQAGPLIAAGWKLVLNLLQGLQDHASELATAGVTIVINLLNAIAAKASQLVQAGGNITLGILRGIAANYSKMVTTGVTLVVNLLRGIAQNVGRLVTAGADLATKFVSKIASFAGRMVTQGTNFIVKFIGGVASSGGKIVSAATSAGTKFLNAIVTATLKMTDAGAKAIIRFINGVAEAVRANSGELNAAGVNLANALIDGAVGVLTSQASNIVERITKPFRDGVNAVKGLLHINSPSKVFEKIGMGIMLGAQNGVDNNAGSFVASLSSVSHSLIAVGNGMTDNLIAGMATNKPKHDTIFKNISKTLHKKFGAALGIQNGTSKTMADIGTYIGKGFTDGLKGSETDITSAFETLDGKFTDAMATARSNIADAQGKLRELLKAKHLDYTAIAKLQATINANEILLQKAKGGRAALTAELKAHSDELIRLSTTYDDFVNKLKDAQTALDNAISAKDSATKSFHDQYAALPDINTDTFNSLPTYLTDLKARAAAVEKYRTTLEQLRSLGLDDATYKKLVDEGPAAQKFADQLISAGPEVITSINGLDSQIETSSSSLATTASNNLYQAGVDSAQGLVNGLTKKRDDAKTAVDELVGTITGAITTGLDLKGDSSAVFETIGIFAMKGLAKGLKKRKGHVYQRIREIAEGMIAELRKTLQIKSPSKVFEDLGQYTTLGMANGLANGAKHVNSAITDVGDGAVNTMQKSVSQLSDILGKNIDANPVIAPVLDLTDVKAGAKQISDLTNVTPITAAASYSQATSIARDRTAAQEAIAADTSTTTPVQQFKFEQNNYSPEALSDAEIYRQTNNQLSQAKKALGLAS